MVFECSHVGALHDPVWMNEWVTDGRMRKWERKDPLFSTVILQGRHQHPRLFLSNFNKTSKSHLRLVGKDTA